MSETGTETWMPKPANWMHPLQKVKRKSDGREGVIKVDGMGLTTPDEVMVVYHGDLDYTLKLVEDLEDLGSVDIQPDLRKCGAGKGAECCRWLTVGPEGPDCERYSEAREYLRGRNDMVASRLPTEPYPDCQIFPGK